MSGALLSFSLTPVQSFIEAARTVRDLKAGSALLSHLTSVAADAAERTGQLIFPRRATSAHSMAIPNLFLARYDSPEDADAAAARARDAVIERWTTIADDVHQQLSREMPADWSREWPEQVDGFWEVETVVLATTDVPSVLQALLGAAPTAIGLGDEFRAVQAVLACRKLTRRSPLDNGIGRHKCALMGEWEQMGPVGVTEAEDFWSIAMKDVTVGGLRLARRDRLCAPALVKRFCKVSGHMTGVGGDIPDTAAVATEAWWSAATEAAAQRADAFSHAVTALRTALRGTADTERRYLLDDDLTPSALARETGVEEADIVAELARVQETRKALLDDLAGHDLGAPPKYYAILVQDGDEMGQWLGGEKCPVDTDFYSTMSGQLQEYAGRVGAIVVDDHKGHLVYAGGDDALALLPLSEILTCAQELRAEFPSSFSSGALGSPTLSAGIAIVHYKYDLRSALRAARAAERRAKDAGRNCLGINLVKRSGGPVGLTLNWDQVPKLDRLRRLFAAGVSDGWLLRTADNCVHLRNWYRGREPVTFLLGQATRGLELTSEERLAVAGELGCSPAEAEDAARSHIRALWEDLWDNTPPPPGISGDCHEFLDLVIDCFLSLGMIASFLNRGRD